MKKNEQKKKTLIVLMVLYALVIVIGLTIFFNPRILSTTKTNEKKVELVKESIKEDSIKRIDRLINSLE